MPLKFYQRVLWFHFMLLLVLIVITDFFVFSQRRARSILNGTSSRDTSSTSPSPYQIHPGLAVCGNNPVFLLMYVHSAPTYWEKRYLIRHTWGSREFISRYLHPKIKLVFMMGAVANASIQAAIERESHLYGDIVQGRFVDHYRNITWKAIMALRWTTQYCSQAKFVLKTDDDVLIHIAAVTQYVQNLGNATNTLWCNVWRGEPARREKWNKWFVLKEEYPDSHYPVYCPGLAVLMSGDLIPQLYKATHHTRFFWIDDIYLTGMLPLKINVTFVNIRRVYAMMVNTETHVNNFAFGSALFFYHHMKTSDWYTLWHGIVTGTIQQALQGT